LSRKLLKNCVIVQAKQDTNLHDGMIAVDDGSIEWVGKASDWPGDVDGETEVLDMQGMYVLPGLWDMHIHLGMTVLKSNAMQSTTPSDTLFSYRRALAFLNAGVTSLRLVGSSADGIDFVLRDAINSGAYVGPRILTAGVGVASTGGHGYRGGAGCDGPYEFRKATRKQLWMGADLIKVMVTGGMGGRYETFTAPQTLEDEVAAAVEVAHNAGKHVAGHIASPEGAIMCSRVGLDTVEHGYALNQKALDVMTVNGTAYVPTLVVSHNPDYWRELGVASWAMKKIQQAHEPHRNAVKLAIESEVTLAIGTDLPTAYMDDAIVTVREMEVFSELGAEPRDIIRWATEVPARICGLEGRVGCLAPGQAADIIAVPDDPCTDISNLRDVRFVMTGGDIIRDAIDGHSPVALPPIYLNGPC